MSFVDDSPNTNHHSSDGKRREVIVMIHPDVHPYDIFHCIPILLYFSWFNHNFSYGFLHPSNPAINNQLKNKTY
jgi:hypothetical protein